MDKVTYDYSLKNIPIPSQRKYMKTLISKVESVVHRMRWKAFFFDKKTKPEEEDLYLNSLSSQTASLTFRDSCLQMSEKYNHLMPFMY